MMWKGGGGWEARDMLNLLIGGDDTVGSSAEVLPLDEILEAVNARWGISFRKEWERISPTADR